MSYKNLLVLLVAVLALVITTQSVSAFGTIVAVEIDGVPVENLDFAEFAGETVDLMVRFDATSNAEDVRVISWISGGRSDTVESERFDVVANRTYIRTIQLPVPFDIDELDEPRQLVIEVESDHEGVADRRQIELTVQRRSYQIEIINVEMQPQIETGETLVIETVIKNIGRQEADNVFLRVTIPELGLETQTFFGDLAQQDNFGNFDDEEDTEERTTFLRIPTNAAPGFYTVQLEAFNGDSFVQLEKRINVVGAGKEVLVIPSSTSKTFSVGEKGEYKLTLVNKGQSVGVFTIVADEPTGLSVDISEPVVVVPAGLSRSVTIFAESDEADTHTFTVRVIAEDGTELSTEVFSAEVEGEEESGVQNTTVLLTVILAIVFIVLLIVLIVLLTRKPEKTEEFGESYY